MTDVQLFKEYKRTAPGGDLAVLVDHYRNDPDHYGDQGAVHAALLELSHVIRPDGALIGGRLGLARTEFYRRLAVCQDAWRRASNARDTRPIGTPAWSTALIDADQAHALALELEHQDQAPTADQDQADQADQDGQAFEVDDQAQADYDSGHQAPAPSSSDQAPTA